MIYLDHHATTPCDPRVVEAMLPWLTERFGNPASRQHLAGRAALEAVEAARRQVAALLGVTAREIVFTSGATEALNLALQGLFEGARGRKPHVIVSAVEHKAVLDTARALVARGARVTVLPVDAGGRVDPDDVAAALTADTLCVALMAANNEIGTLQPIERVAALCREAGVACVCDAAQAAGKVPLDAAAADLDLVALSAHKLYGPKGVGALAVRARRPRLALEPQQHGGGHERGLRSGTLNVPAIVGFGVACDLAAAAMAEEGPRLAALRDRLLAGLRAGFPDLLVNGTMAHRLPHNLSVAFPRVEARRLLQALGDICVSSGSACMTATDEPSHVLRALGLADDRVHASIRFGLGRFNTADEIDTAAERIAGLATRLRR